MTETYSLAVDQGTTSSRAILFNSQGEIISQAQEEFTQIYPHDGWVEHDAKEILATQQRVIHNVLSANKDKLSLIKSMGITNQRETIVAWNKRTGEPIYNAIVWQDTRTSAYCNQLITQGENKSIYRKTGLVLDSYFSGSKVRWILNNVSEAKTLLATGDLLFGTIDAWLLWHFTQGKVHATDVSNASRTMLYNINTLEWDDELLQLFEVPKLALPEVKDSNAAFGNYTYDGYEIPITSMMGDQQAALYGQGCFTKGSVKNTYGTGCFMLLNIGDKPLYPDNGLLTTIAWSKDGQIQYALEGSVFIGGAAVQWLRDGINIIDSATETQSLAEKSTVQDLVFVPAFAGLGTPHWDMGARGMLIGITRNTTVEDIVKATLEGIAHQCADLLDSMKEGIDTPIKLLKVDGGASANTYLMQYQSNVMQVDISRPHNIESTAWGVARMSAEHANLKYEFADHPTLYTPQMEVDQQRELRTQWADAVNRTRGWIK